MPLKDWLKKLSKKKKSLEKANDEELEEEVEEKEAKPEENQEEIETYEIIEDHADYESSKIAEGVLSHVIKTTTYEHDDDSKINLEKVAEPEEPVITEKEHVVPETALVLTKKGKIVTKKGKVIPKKGHAVTQKEKVVPEKEKVVPEKEQAFTAKRERLASILNTEFLKPSEGKKSIMIVDEKAELKEKVMTSSSNLLETLQRLDRSRTKDLAKHPNKSKRLKVLKKDIKSDAEIFRHLAQEQQHQNNNNLGPSEQNPCLPETCIKKCFTCGPPATVHEDYEIQELKRKSYDGPSTLTNKGIQKLKMSNVSKSDLLERQPSCNQLIAAPITDEGMSHLDLTDALTILMKEGVIDPEYESDTEQTIKAPVKLSWWSSSEDDNAIYVEAEEKKIESRVEAARNFRTRAKSEMIVTRTALLVDECVNTSFSDMRFNSKDDEYIYRDSLIQMKRGSRLDADSLTQYFAYKSSLQLEAYLLDKRKRKQKNEMVVGADWMPPRDVNRSLSDSVIVVHQPGQIALSVASFAKEYDENVTQHMLKSNNQERLVALVNLRSTSDILKKTKSVATEEVAEKEKPTGCTRCKVKPERESSDVPIDEDKFAGLQLRKNTDTSSKKIKDSITKLFRTSTSSDPKINSLDTSDISFNKDSRLDSDISAEPKGEVFTLMLLTLLPSRDLFNIPKGNEDDADTRSISIRWNFLRYTDSFTITINKKQPEYSLNYVKNYEFNISKGLYIYLTRCTMTIELYSMSYATRTLLGKCGFKVGKCFDDLSITYENKLEFNNKDLCLCYPNISPRYFGYLVVRYKIRGEQEKFDECRPEKVMINYMPPLVEIADTRATQNESVSSKKYERESDRQNSYSIVSEAELQAFQDGLNLVLVRNKALRTTQEEITNELKDRTTWMHEELKWKLTLQENAILCGKDPNQVKWRQWKDDTTANVRYRPISHEEYFKDYTAHIEIEILDLVLEVDSKPMNDDNVTHIYIELSFLNKSGVDMETTSLKKPIDEKPMKFKHKNVFDITLNDEDAVLLAEMIKNNESMTFTVISQPIEDVREIQCCTDIGEAKLILFNLMQNRFNSTVEIVPVVDSYKKNVNIGTLKVKFTGILAMRSMALHILTPNSFKIIR